MKIKSIILSIVFMGLLTTPFNAFAEPKIIGTAVTVTKVCEGSGISFSFNTTFVGKEECHYECTHYNKISDGNRVDYVLNYVDNNCDIGDYQITLSDSKD